MAAAEAAAEARAKEAPNELKRIVTNNEEEVTVSKTASHLTIDKPMISRRVLPHPLWPPWYPVIPTVRTQMMKEKFFPTFFEDTSRHCVYPLLSLARNSAHTSHIEAIEKGLDGPYPHLTVT